MKGIMKDHKSIKRDIHSNSQCRLGVSVYDIIAGFKLS